MDAFPLLTYYSRPFPSSIAHLVLPVFVIPAGHLLSILGFRYNSSVSDRFLIYFFRLRSCVYMFLGFNQHSVALTCSSQSYFSGV